MQLQQVNVRLPKAVATRLRVEAAKNNIPLQALLGIAASEFMNQWTPEERQRFYTGVPASKGRPLPCRRNGRKATANQPKRHDTSTIH